MRGLGPVLTVALTAALLVAACGDRAPELSPDERAARVQGLIIRGVAHAEIEGWPEAVASFTAAAELAGDEPVLAFNLGVAHLRGAEPEAAEAWLDRVDEAAPSTLRARTEYARGKLALERGDARGEAAAYRRAIELDPSDPAYPYALSQVVPRLDEPDPEAAVGELLAQAHRLWPGNARLTAELAQWLLGRPQAEARRLGLELLEGLTAGEAAPRALFERGRAELAEDPERTPVSLRRAINLLRPGKRFQVDSAALEARLALLPLPEPATPELRAPLAPAPVTVALEPAALLPPPPFAAGERLLDAVAFDDVAPGEEETAVESGGAAPAAGAREAQLALLSDRALWLLEREGGDYRRLAETAGGRRLLAAELDGDGRMELLVLGDGGVTLLGRGAAGEWGPQPLEPGLAAAAGLRSALPVDFEHDGDLDLLAIGPAGGLLLVTHRGEAGLGPPEPAPPPLSPDVLPGPAAALAATDLDGDADQDLLVAGEAAILVLANWRQGDFRPLAELPLAAPLESWTVLDLDGDGRFDLAAAVGGRLALWRNRGRDGLTRDAAAEARAAALLGQPAAGDPGVRVRSLAAADLDMDGREDLLVGYGSAASGGRAGSGEGAAGEGPGLLALAGPAAGGAAAGIEPIARLEGVDGRLAAAIDLDGDCDPDPLLVSADGAATLRGAGAEAAGCLELRLRGLAGKVPLDGRGARLDVWFGLERRSRELDRPAAIVGLGGRRPSLVEVTWPNGISEYLFDPEPGTRRLIEQELRIEGSCPFLYASDGERLRFVTDILSLAPVGMLAAPGRYVPADPEEYLRLPDWVAARERVELRITEELREVAYIDQTELVVVDAPPGVEVYNGERWFPGRVEGLDLRLLGPLEPLAAARDAAGRDVLAAVAEVDHRYLAHSEGERLYQGAAKLASLELEVSPRLAGTGRVSLVLTGWLHWGNTSTNVARAQDPRGAPVFPYVEVPDGEGGWRRLELDAGLPAGKTKPVVVALAGRLDPADPRLRITTDFEVYWDRIAAAETLDLPAVPHRVHRLAPRRAELSWGGFSRWYRPAPNGPYLFDYADRRPYPWRPTAGGERAIAWQEHEGYYTPFGDVAGLVGAADGEVAIFGSGEELALSFDVAALPPLAEGWSRTLFLHLEGWEKDGDPNVACAQTVGPLPSRGPVPDPCAGDALAAAPDAAVSSGAGAGGRWVDRHRLERRVRGFAGGPVPRPGASSGAGR